MILNNFGITSPNSITTAITTSNSKSSNISITPKNPVTVFVFAGQGSQYNTMAMELYNNEPTINVLGEVPAYFSEYITNHSFKYPNIEIACYNSPTSIVFRGEEKTLNQKEKGIFLLMLGSLSFLHQLDFSQTISNLFKHIETNQLGSDIVFIELAPHATILFKTQLYFKKTSTQGPTCLSLIGCSSNIKSYQTFLGISRIPFQYLKGHVINGKYYFPGYGYIQPLNELYSTYMQSIDSPIQHPSSSSSLSLIYCTNEKS
ncbi:hypothetical protein ACTFIV_010699 [Dictyostelium citrinum]